MPRRLPCLALLLGLLLLAALPAQAQAQGEGYALPFWTIDNGGGQSAGGGYLLRSEVGRAEAQSVATGSVYTLRGGIWHPGVIVVDVEPSQRSLWLPQIANQPDAAP